MKLRLVANFAARELKSILLHARVWAAAVPKLLFMPLMPQSSHTFERVLRVFIAALMI
jgi:hypothetical protein